LLGVKKKRSSTFPGFVERGHQKARCRKRASSTKEEKEKVLKAKKYLQVEKQRRGLLYNFFGFSDLGRKGNEGTNTLVKRGGSRPEGGGNAMQIPRIFTRKAKWKKKLILPREEGERETSLPNQYSRGEGMARRLKPYGVETKRGKE